MGVYHLLYTESRWVGFFSQKKKLQTKQVCTKRTPAGLPPWWSRLPELALTVHLCLTPPLRIQQPQAHLPGPLLLCHLLGVPVQVHADLLPPRESQPFQVLLILRASVLHQMARHHHGLIEDADIQLGIVLVSVFQHGRGDALGEGCHETGAAVVEQDVHAALVVFEGEEAPPEGAPAGVEDVEHGLPEGDGARGGFHVEDAVADGGDAGAAAPDVLERVLFRVGEEFAGIGGEDGVDGGVGEEEGGAGEDGVGVEEEDVEAGGEDVDEEFGAFEHHLLEGGGVVAEVLVGGDGVEGRVVVGVVALGVEGAFGGQVEGPEEDGLRGEVGGGEGAEQVEGVGEHAGVDGDDDEGVVDGDGAEASGGGGVDVGEAGGGGVGRGEDADVEGEGDEDEGGGQGEEGPAYQHD